MSKGHGERRELNDIGGRLTNSDDDDDRHRGVRGSRLTQKTSAVQSAGRELPPRFQRKQQIQTKDLHYSGESPTTSSFSSISSGIRVQADSGNYSPSMPGMSGGGSPSSGRVPEDVNLRPARQFAPLLKPNTPAMLPRSAQCTSGARAQMSTPVGPLVQQQITVIQVPTLDKSKDKSAKASVEISRDDLLQIVESTVKSLLENGDVSDAAKCIRDIKPPTRHVPEMLNYLMTHSLDTTDDDRDVICRLISALKTSRVVNSDHFLEMFTGVVERVSDLELKHPLAMSHIAQVSAGAVAAGVVTLADIATPLAGGVAHPLYLLCLQRLTKITDKDWMLKAFNESKVNLITMLPELDRSKERVMEILDDRGLTFLQPLLRIQSDLLKQLNTDANPASFYAWIRDNVDASLHSDPAFITALVTTVIQYVASETTLTEGVDSAVGPDKSLVEKEKALLEKFQSVLKKFLQDKIPLHVTAIYALQVFTYNCGSPKGMLLRMFVNLYGLEVIDEDAFMTWKEEVDDTLPGKGQALFQVNQWLMWLEQAEEETDDDDDDDE